MGTARFVGGCGVRVGLEAGGHVSCLSLALWLTLVFSSPGVLHGVRLSL